MRKSCTALSTVVARMFRAWGLRYAGEIGKLAGQQGAYLLLLRIPHARIRIGALGHRQFAEGLYAYVGSAMGQSVTLGHRLARHFRKMKPRRWHIDYLTSHPAVEPLAAFVSSCDSASEERIAKLCATQFGVIPRFGSSDMKTSPGHLFILQPVAHRLLESSGPRTCRQRSATS